MSPYRVLIAEDEPYAARYLRALVEEPGLFRVAAVCESGEEALALLEREAVDVMITDIKMSGMTGLELLRRCHDRRPEMLTIIVSGYGEFDYAQEAIALGVSRYLLKPVNGEELLSALQEAYDQLERRRQHSHEALLRTLRERSEALLDDPAALPGRRYRALMAAGSFSQEALILRCQNAFRIAEDPRRAFLLYRHALVLLEDADTPEPRLEEAARRILGWETGTGSAGLLLLRTLPMDREALGAELRLLYAYHQRHLVLGRMQLLPYPEERPAPAADAGQEKQQLAALLQDLNARNDKSFYRDFCRLFAYWEEAQASLYSIKQAVYCLIIHLFQVDANSIDPVVEINRVLRELYGCATYQQAQECVWRTVESLISRVRSAQSSSQPQSQQIFWRIIEYLNTHIRENFSLQEISDTFGISQPYVSKLFRMYSGQSYKEYVTGRKIATAISLMERDRNILIKDVAEQVGYDQLYFSTVFYRITGQYPKQYKEDLWRRKEERDAP